MSNYNCKRFCGRSFDFICQTCLLKETSAQKIMEELISRKLVMVQRSSHTGKIEGYYIWKQNIDKEKK